MRADSKGLSWLTIPLDAAACRRARICVGAASAMILALFVVSSPAAAVQTHGLEFTFDGTGSTAGKFTDLGSIGIHQATGDVYAIDRGAGVIDKFNASGSPEDFSALGSSSIDVEATCPGFEFPSTVYRGRDDLAVDSSGGPTDGNIYVATDSVDPGAPPGTSPGVCAYNSAGEFLWKDSEQAADGLAVDSEGHLWLGAFTTMFELENTGSPPEVLNEIPGSATERYERLAVDSNENVYANFFGDRTLARYKFTGLQSIVQPGPTGALGIDPATNHLYVTEPEGFREYELQEASPGAFQTVQTSKAGEDTFGAGEGIAVQASTGDVYVSDGQSQKIYVFGPVGTFAAITMGSATSIRRTTATATATVDPDGGGAVTECHVEYGLTKAYGSSAPCNEETPYASVTPVTADLSGLEGGTTYHFRFFASDAAGQNKGSDQTFTTPYVSGVSTAPASNLDRTSATLNGSLDPDGLSTSYYFQWGLTTGYGNTSPAGPPGESVGPSPGSRSVSADVSGLEPNTLYHYRVVALNASGRTVGEDETLLTHPPIKNLSTVAPSEIGPDGAQLNGTFDPDGFDTHYYFEWGRDQSYGHVTAVLPGDDAGSVPGAQTVSAAISELEDYTAYHYRLVATNSFGTTVGEDVEFLSAPPFNPTVSGTTPVAVTETTATITAKIDPGFGPTVYLLQYGTDLPYSSRTALSEPIGEDGSEHLVTRTLANLSPATTYHVRVVATNFSGSVGGQDIAFQTAAPPGVDVTSASDVGQTTATLHAQILPNSSPTTFHFDYGPGPEYGQRTPESGSVGSDALSHAATAVVSGLSPHTTYHFRVVATNAYGSVEGPDQTFATAPALSSEPKKPGPECKRGFKERRGKCVKIKHRARHHRRGGRHRG